MRPAHLLGSLALSSLAVLGAAGAAGADEQPSLSITPSPGRPGESVVVSVSGGCSASSATATSDAFTASVPLSTGSAGTYTGNATIRSNATPGNHSVEVACPGGATSTYTIRVAGSSPTASPTPAGVRGGLGGTQEGTTSTDIAIGVGLVALAGAGTVVVLRRRARAGA